MNGTEQVAQRIVNAERNFVAYVQGITGCEPMTAEAVLAYYKKERLVKIRATDGTWNVKHGIFLDAAVLNRAVNIVALRGRSHGR